MSWFSAVQGATPFTGSTASARHSQYTGSLNFNNTAPQNFTNSGDLNSTWFGTATNAGPGSYGISGYSGSGNHGIAVWCGLHVSGELPRFQWQSAVSNFAYGSLYTIDLGTLTAGTVLSITHDDGASVFQGSTQIGTSTTGPTTQVTDLITTIATTADTTLYYSRQNGQPVDT